MSSDSFLAGQHTFLKTKKALPAHVKGHISMSNPETLLFDTQFQLPPGYLPGPTRPDLVDQSAVHPTPCEPDGHGGYIPIRPEPVLDDHLNTLSEAYWQNNHGHGFDEDDPDDEDGDDDGSGDSWY